MNTSLRTLLSEVARRLEEAGDFTLATCINGELEKNDAAVEDFLRSNELWGGSGSIADQAGITADRAKRRKIEIALMALGEAQLQEGIANPRTGVWIDVFRQWRDAGI